MAAFKKFAFFDDISAALPFSHLECKHTLDELKKGNINKKHLFENCDLIADFFIAFSNFLDCLLFGLTPKWNHSKKSGSFHHLSNTGMCFSSAQQTFIINILGSEY